MRPLGVGAVYLPALEPLFGEDGALVSVLELEPQTLWEQVAHAGRWCYRDDPARLDRIAALRCARLIHGIGQPLGGSVPDPIAHADLLRRTVDRLDPAWCSEHLSFNRIRRGRAIEHAGFLLPPPQTPAAARLAADNVRAYGQRLGRPVAFETGVNYLRREAGDLDDGDFFAAVARNAGCGILLDLHNLWCNERNGRETVAEVLAKLPLDQVWELHLAGGTELHGYWLDAHSGAVPGEVLEIAARLVPALPNLGAIVYEIMPEQLPRFGIDAVHREIESLHALWKLRAPHRISMARAVAQQPVPLATPADVDAVATWEMDLVDALRGARTTDPRVARLRADPGWRVLRELVDDARRASLAQALRYTVTLLLLALGTRETLDLLDTYLIDCPPEPFNAVEAERFARFLRARLPRVSAPPHLQEVLAYEHAVLRASLHGESTELTWTTAPATLLESLEAGRLPIDCVPVHCTMQVCAA